MKIVKWIYALLFLPLSAFSIHSSLDDRGASIADFVSFVAIALALLFGALTFFAWKRIYVATRSHLSLLFTIIPFLAIIGYAGCWFETYRKVNKPYHLSATLFHDRNYEYYFRDDSTLKIVGHFRFNDAQTFQPYKIQGNFILLDTIIPCTGIVSKRYKFEISSDGASRFLAPVNEKGAMIDSLSLFISRNIDR